MSFGERANAVFDRAVADYHLADDVDAPCPCPYGQGTLEALLYDKCMVDARQWHLEDVIRDPRLPAARVVLLKRRIDGSNQLRTDMVEALDSRFRRQFGDVVPSPDATVNTESPAWAVDRLSILALKVWHMREQARRGDVDAAHRRLAEERLAVLEEQRADLSAAIDRLLDDIAAGRKYMKVYRQMKLYNDPATNPALYRK